MGRGKEKEKYRMIPILILMKCLRPILRELIIGKAKAQTPHGEKHWTVDDFLGHYRKQIERNIQKFDDYDKYLSVLYPSDGRSDFGKWDLKLTIFILKDVCALGSNFKYYIGDILNIRDQLCVPHNSGITRIVCKEYKRRFKSARSHFYRLLHNDDLKKTIERRAHNIKNEMKNTSDVKDILKRWEELENDSVPNGCGKTGVEKYIILNILLSETCCEVMQSLIRKKVKENGHRLIDTFLWEHEKRIRRRIGTLDGFGRAEDLLLPPKSQRTNIREWDVTLMSWVLLNVCFLDEYLADAIGSIRRIRNETIHKLSTSMNVSHLEYQKYFEDITKSIDKCLLYLDDADYSEDIHNQIEALDRNGVDKDETIRRLQICQRDRVDLESQHKHLQGQAAIIEELSQILKTISGFELPACTLEVVLQNCSEECEKELSNILVEKINQVIGKDTSPENRSDELTTAIKDFVDRYRVKGWKPLCAENGSVLFNTKCNSFNSLYELYDTHQDEGSRSCVSAVEDAIQHMFGRRVHLCVVMHNAEMDKCMAAIVSSLYGRIKELEVKVNKVKTTSKGRINIWMALNGEECSSDTSESDGKDLAQRLTNIADILQKRYQTPNLTVTATLHDFSEDSHENLNDKVRTISYFSGKHEAISDINEQMNTEAIYDISSSCSDGEDIILGDFRAKVRAMHNLIPTKERARKAFEFAQTNLSMEYLEILKKEGAIFKEKMNTEVIFDEPPDACQEIYQKQAHDEAFSAWYNYLKRCFQADLINVYRQSNLYNRLSTLFGDDSAKIDDLYAPLDIGKRFLHPKTNLRRHCQWSDVSEVIQVTDYNDIFYSNGHLAEKIYVTAAAGLGKTTFCKKLVSDWCKSWQVEYSSVSTLSQHHIESQINPKTDNNPLLKFDFVFLVFLKEMEDASVEDLISNQLGVSKERLADYFLKFKCLVILDGLDEWIPSIDSDTKKIPVPKFQNRCTTLVTSRGSILDHTKTDLDGHVCEIAIKGIGSNSDMLIRSIFKSICKGKRCSERYDIYAKQFLNEVKTRNIEGLLSNPYVLKILLHLWLQEGKLNPSLSELYEKISRVLIKKACLIDSHGNGAAKCVNSCAEGSSLMLSLLQSLAKLAYFNLFSEHGNITPVLHLQALENALTPTERAILLCSGILSQNTRFSYHNLSKYVFVHKSFQEYFAAGYISSNSETCIQQITDAWMSLEKGFEMSNVFLFLSSMNPDAMELVYYHIGRLTGGDKINQVCRLLCDNGKLVEKNYVILVNPLDGLVVNIINEKHFLVYKKMKLLIDADTTTPYWPWQYAKDISHFGVMLSRLQNFERWFTFEIPEEDLEQLFASASNRESVIMFRSCCYADEKGKSKLCKHGLKTEPSLCRVIQTACTTLCRDKVDFYNMTKPILEFCLFVKLRLPEPLNRYILIGILPY